MMWTGVVFFAFYQILHVSSIPPLLGSAVSEIGPAVQKAISNEDARLNFTALAGKYGYPTETHTVVTEDGYILTVFRLGRAGAAGCAGGARPPLLMVHGLLDSSDTYIVAGPGVGLAYLLADAGHDVWCLNHRGNRYSRRHVTLDPDADNHYWNFTRDEHGARDLPAVVDYMINVTGSATINYIGHSQGTTDFFILNSARPDYNRKFNLAICLAPVAWLHHIATESLQTLAKIGPEIKLAADVAGLKEFGAHGKLTNIAALGGCELSPNALCDAVINELTGSHAERIGANTLATALGHYPAGTSLKSLLGYGQGVNVDSFSRFDHGEAGNLAAYGSCAAPQYDVRRVSAPVALICADGDKLSVRRDVARLLHRLPNVVAFHLIPDEDWGHVDYVWGDRIPTVLMPKIHEYLNNY